jgi:Lactate racemase N-terminal domain
VKLPLVVGSRATVVTAPENATVVAPPPPVEPVADVGAAVRDALRFPLSGEPLEALATPGGRTTIVVEHPSLPIPGTALDPRRDALAATVEELARLGITTRRQTILVAGGLERRIRTRDAEELVTPMLARSFRGRVQVHDCEDPELVQVGESEGLPLRINRALVESDLVLTVTAAETVLHGGPAALLAAGGAAALRAAGARSLLAAAGSRGWTLEVELERALARRVPVLGLSLSLGTPSPRGFARGYPHDPEAVERLARSRLRPLFGLLPTPVRRRVLHSLPVDLRATAAYAGPPSVAHTEALLTAVEARAGHLGEPLDALCIAVPGTSPHLPRERPNPLLAAYLGLGLALRLWRDSFPLVEGGTVILMHRFHRRFPHPTQQPYREFFRTTRKGVSAGVVDPAPDEPAIAAYRSGQSCHPLLPYVDWDGCQPALERAGAVIVAGCRDAAAARQLGFVPTHGLPAALRMAEGRAGGSARIGFLLAPPYFPISVSPP